MLARLADKSSADTSIKLHSPAHDDCPAIPTRRCIRDHERPPDDHLRAVQYIEVYCNVQQTVRAQRLHQFGLRVAGFTPLVASIFELMSAAWLDCSVDISIGPGAAPSTRFRYGPRLTCVPVFAALAGCPSREFGVPYDFFRTSAKMSSALRARQPGCSRPGLQQTHRASLNSAKACRSHQWGRPEPTHRRECR